MVTCSDFSQIRLFDFYAGVFIAHIVKFHNLNSATIQKWIYWSWLKFAAYGIQYMNKSDEDSLHVLLSVVNPYLS